VYINDTVNLTADSKSITIKFEVDDVAEFYADHKQANIIIENVVTNALKFSLPQSEIIVSTAENGDYLDIIVQDYGVGMSDENLNSLKDGQMATQSTNGTQNEKGTGLGILLVKQLLINNNGNLKIESTLGKGTKVILEFPKFADNITVSDDKSTSS
jgi:signal transduction histidine kinase